MAESSETTNLASPSATLTSTEEVDAPVPLPRAVQNGLQLRQSNQELPFKTFTYTPAIPSKTPPTPVDWRLLASFHVEGEHIRLHELKEGQDLKALIEDYRSAHAKAVVVVNSNETRKLPDDIVTTLKDFESYLIAVISSSDGTTLFDCLETQFQDEDVYAKLEITSVNDTPLAVFGEDEDTAVLEMDPTLPQRASDPQNRGLMSKLFGSSGRTYDLKGEVKKLMFDGEIMKPVTSDAGVFTLVMSTFTQYEKSSKADSNQIKELLQRFLKYFDPAFPKEFPFFITLAHRLRTYRHLYECDELGPFVTRCINTFEGLPPQQIAETLIHFIDQKDFDIMYGSEEVNMSMFQLLATACKEMMNLSAQIKRSQQRQTDSPLNRVIYSRILWISVHLKCLSEKGITTRATADIWLEHLLRPQISQSIELKRVVIEDFKLGLSFTSLLKLPPEIQFTAHHMTHFLANERFIRPLVQARDFILALESNIKNDRELLVLVLVNLRSLYQPFLSSSNPKDVCRASQEGTLLGVIDEGISFLDGMMELWFRRGWHKGEQHKDFRNECLKWLKLLLKTVKVTDPSAPQLLKKFLAQRRHSIVADQEFRNNIVKQILEDTRNSFCSLSIQLFFTLYKTFRIWPIDFLHEFLKQYRIPDTVKINDATWSEFFNVVLERFPGDEHQHHLLTFLCKVGDRYKETGRSKEFIPDLLQLNVPQLFIIPADANQEMEEASVGQKFSSFLKSYIQRNNLQSVILDNMQTILSKFTDKSDINFHWIILSVLQSVIVPELKALQTTDNESLRSILSVSVNTLCQNIEWFGSLSARQKFCWGVVSIVCSKLSVTADNFDWVIQYQPIIGQLGVVFNTYCNTRKIYDMKCLLSDYMPDEVQHCPWDDVNKYFQWVTRVQDILRLWQSKFLQYKVNYDEILLYASNNVALSSLGRAVCASSFVMDLQDISQIKDTYTYCFEQLNVYLLRYVPGHPEVKYCTLPALLTKYGVGLPPNIQEAISKYIFFPGEQRVTKNQRLKNVIPPPSTRLFEPGQDITLKVSKLMTLSDLQRLLEDLMKFLEPLLSYLDMVVFFHLNQSEMFEKHLLKELEKVISTSSPYLPRTEKTGFSLFPSLTPSVTVFGRRDSSTSRHAQLSAGVSIENLQKALEKVKDLMFRILKGTATYADIIAEGALKLESVNTDKEFSILSGFSEVMEMRQEQCEGLQGVRSMLELFQFTQHIQTIYSVCEQYGLENCLKDDTLKQLMTIMEELRPEGSRAKLTPLDSMQKMYFIKKSLCLEGRSNYSCLNLFPAVANSAAFYQFVRDKQFVGPRGQAIFREQYQLITAQLQHEEYDENVLNHLRAAFEFLAPFMEQDTTFHDLMSKVARLDTTHGLKQLETVNENITLIRLWFSRAEGDTIENVANELDNILSTGCYTFQLSGIESSILLMYESQQKIISQRKQTPQPQPELKPRLATQMPTLPTVYPSPQPQTIPTPFFSKEDTPTMGGGIEQRWTNEQIADFVRKLGFLDAEKEGGEKIKLFLHLNSTAYKLMELYIKLNELGHPKYQAHRRLPSLFCNVSNQEADTMVQSLEDNLQEWTEKVAALRQQYTWLLFFSVPKLLRLHSLTRSPQNSLTDQPEVDLDSIVHDICFLFENDLLVRRRLKPVVQQALQYCLTNLEDKEDSPMHFLGHFLQIVCESSELKQFLLRQRSSRRGSISLPRPTNLSLRSPAASGTPLGMYQLHYAPGYTHSQILRLICELYEGVPESFEVFRCRPTTTHEELNLFMERVRHHPLSYLILQVNKLPFKLQELLMNLPRDHKGSESNPAGLPTVHFVETAPSVLREVPWITYREYKDDSLCLTFEEAARLSKRKIIKSADFTCVQLVIGHAGDGKTHYIQSQSAMCPGQLTIAVNEAFTPLSAIHKLNKLPSNTTGCAIFFNFTLTFYQGTAQDEEERLRLEHLLETISWFFFDLLVLGYVEDPATGTSFRFPGGLEWALYIEVPSLDHQSKPEESLHLFCQAIPALGLLGSPHVIHPATHYAVDDDVQLVCKYLRAYKMHRQNQTGINRLYRDVPLGYVQGSVFQASKIVKFSQDENLTNEECHRLLTEFMPDHIQLTKITQKLFIKYMKRRCAFLDTLPAFNYNTGIGEPIIDESGQKIRTDTRQLGSTLMSTMLDEVNNFCHPSIQANWSNKPHQQLIYDFRDGGGSFGLLSLHLENLPEENRKKYKKIGFELHSNSKLQERGILDQYLARALGLPSEEGNRLSAIDDASYVLTLDYTIKMLNIHERYECGVPVIIKGETGVGKTALVDMLSKLWSHALLHLWSKERGIILDAIRDLLSIKAEDSLDTYQVCLETMEAIAIGAEVSVDNLVILCQLSDPTTSTGQFYTRLRDLLLEMANNPAFALLKLPSEKNKKKNKEELEKEEDTSLDDVYNFARANNSPESTAYLLQCVLKAKVINTFHKLNVHAALRPSDIKKFFEPVFEQAERLCNAYKKADEKKKTKIKMPFVTVFLDEVNTSSCLGLFKEIIVDKTLDGQSIPSNVFIVAACNPHRGNSMATHAAETFVRGSYYVRPLHPTLEFLIWDYGSLDEYQERDYIRAKLQMLHETLPNIEVVTLTDLIVESQSLMRRYAMRQLHKLGMKPEEVDVSSRSCVSQRDIQRVFTFYQWLMSVYEQQKHHGDRKDYNRRAIMVSLGIVYYMRLNSEFREEYRKVLDDKYNLPHEVNFSQAFFPELDWFCSSIELPPGIAKTQALKENLFATIVCTVTHTPLIIVGAPGSSKTLSFNLGIANLKGPESKMPLFRNVNIFKSLDPHFYQCSRRTTSNEIQTVFSRAINRQRSHSKFSLPIYCVVFMDEAGLPEESHESLKVLHYHLDKQEVSFVAITNHVLDAAKTNRAVSLFRPEVSNEDLKTLAKGCLCETPENPPPELRKDLDIIVQFCPAYTKLMENEHMRKFFGLRDFIHFINYLRRRRTEMLTPQLIMEGLERNFNGIYWALPGEEESFGWLCEMFLGKMLTIEDKPVSLDNVSRRSILEVLHESLFDRPQRGGGENEVRYKLIIDPSEDNSLVQLLMTFGVLDRKKTHVYVCSDFPGDGQLQKINTIAAIRHSAIEGHTVVMSQTDDIHESFYDLFNQRFRRIDDPEHGPRYYANIAIGAHLKPCRVHGDFQCVVVVRQSEVQDTPAPFLNRFEKYYISHKTLLTTAMNHLPPCVRVLLTTAQNKVEQFISVVNGDSSLYGLKSETLDSLLLSLLPPYGHKYQDTPPQQPVGDDIRVYLLQELLRSLRHSAGFAVPVCTIGELEMDADHLFPLLFRDAAFEGAYQTLTIDSAHQAVSTALKVLHTATDPQAEGVVQTEMSPEASLVVGLLQQWLIRHMTKQLMKLMTSEAVTLHRKQIPASYSDNYLTYQQHFSIKKLLDLQFRALEYRKGDISYCASKLLVFTRSSPLIHELPSQFPNPIGAPREKEHICISELVFSDPQQVMVTKLSAIQSQSKVNEILKTFIHSPSKKILLLMVNMQEASRQMINHLRVMIEEAESQAPPISNKLFVVLLHFPPAMFFDACYPSLFLRGWSHYYLDSIGHSPILHPGTLDIEEWFQRCCFPNKDFPDDSLMKACERLLGDVIPVLASHVTYGTRSSGPFTKPMKAAERNTKLRELLDTKKVGMRLCKLFRACWRAPVMVEHLERAAAFTRSHESSLNITDAVQAMFQSAFTDFMIVMVSRINENRNLDVLFSDECTDIIEELFLSLLESFPTPKLTQLKALAGSLTPPRPQDHQPKFPFFNLVYSEVEKLVEEAKKVKGDQEDLLEEKDNDLTPPPSTLSQIGHEDVMREVADYVIFAIEWELDNDTSNKRSVCTTFQYLLKYPDELWTRYFADFTHHCLHLDTGASSLSFNVIHAFFSDLHQLPPIQRLVYLHIYVEYNKLSLANIASLLRPLEKIWQVAEGAPHAFYSTEQSPSKDFIAAVQQTKYPFGDPQRLSEFVISAMFSALVGSVYPKSESSEQTHFNPEVLLDWYHAYLQIMTMTALKTHLYTTPLPLKEEAKFNIMHSTYLVMYSYSQPSKEAMYKAIQVVMSLLSKYFRTDLKLKDPEKFPHLSECAIVICEVTKDSGSASDVDMELSRRILEGLFSHFFSQFKSTYSTVDRDWFLKLSNSQHEWRASNQLLNEVVISSSFSGDLVSAMESSLKKTRYRPNIVADIPDGCVTLYVFKMVLSRLLGHCDQQSNESAVRGAGPLLMYNPEVRQHIAAVLSANSDGGEPGPYIPVFYQDSKSVRECRQAENRLMQQPLCHLYFLTLLEHLTSEPRDVNSLVRIAHTITQLYRPQSVDLGEKILLHIEKQAIVQCLLQQIALQFNSNENKPVITQDLPPVMVELNELLEDQSMGGGMVGGHRLTLGMHLLRHLRSARRFTDLLTSKYESCRDIQCMQYFHQQLKTQTESKPYMFPFMQISDNSPLSKLYQHVRTAMLNIDETRGSQAAIDQLLKIADECANPRPKTIRPDSLAAAIDRRLAFRMMVWLVAYYDFFFAKKVSQVMCLVVGKDLKPYIREDGVIRLIQCFLQPRWLLTYPESPNPLREDAPVIKVLPNGQIKPVQRDGPTVDPLYELLIPPRLAKRDQSDLDLCHCMANLAAVIIGCQPQSNHLWYHLFSPHELKDTYMTGFMYNSKISPEGLLYDCGVELTADGQYGRPDYIKHATRGTYTLHSLYFLLWANFGSFCMSILTQTNSQSKLHGTIISDWQAIRHYCVSQLKTMWMHIRNNLSVSDEERSFLVTRCLMNLYQTNMDPTVTFLGKLKTSEELNEYETLWHNKIFLPAWQELRQKFAQYSMLWQNKVFIDIKALEACYPQFPNEKSFLNSLQGEENTMEEKNGLRILTHFALEKRRLEVGGQLLPALIELYQWLHTHLVHLVTLERAYNKLTIGRVIYLASRRGNPTLIDLYNKVKNEYNLYVELVGGAIGQGACAAVRRGNRIYTIADDLPLIHFLSDSEEEGEGNDWLYAVIKDIVDAQNLFIHTLYADIGGEPEHPLSRLLTPDPTYIYAAEANEHSCIVGKQQNFRGMSEFLQLIRSRLEPALTTHIPGTTIRVTPKLMSLSGDTVPRPSLLFNLHFLQEDIVAQYLSGKPMIHDISSLRNVFKFRQSKNAAVTTQLSDPMGAAFSLSSMEQALKLSLCVPLPDGLERRLEYEFHSANYHILTDIVIGLRTALGHLIQVLPVDGGVSQDLEETTLHAFMLVQYDCPEVESASVFVNIGIKNLVEPQLACLAGLKLAYLYSTLKLFLRWVKEGMYDFSGLPMALKVHLSDNDCVVLEQIPAQFPGTLSQLLTELKGLSEVLLHVEAHLVKEVNEQARKPLIELLQELSLLDKEHVIDLIPKTVLVQHYVKFRIQLRRITAIVEQRVAIESSLPVNEKGQQWAEYVDNLWSEGLPHLRDEGFLYIDPALVFDPSTGRYGFFGEDWDMESTSELAHDLNEDISERSFNYDDDSFQPISMDYDDPFLYQDQMSMTTLDSDTTLIHSTTRDASVRETLRQGLEDPRLREEMLRLITQKKDTDQHAREWSPERVAKFLESIGLEKHTKNFIEEEIDGSQLLSANREVFQDLGVTSLVESTRISVLFRRKLQSEEKPSYPLEDLLKTTPKLKAYKPTLEKAGIDLNMMLYAQQNGYLDDFLKECGVNRALDRNKFDTKLKELPTSQSPSPEGREVSPPYIAYSTPV